MSKIILPIVNKLPWHPALGVWFVMMMAGILFREMAEKAGGTISRPLVRVSTPLIETSILDHGRNAVWCAFGIMEYLAELRSFMGPHHCSRCFPRESCLPIPSTGNKPDRRLKGEVP